MSGGDKSRTDNLLCESFRFTEQLLIRIGFEAAAKMEAWDECEKTGNLRLRVTLWAL